MIKRITLIKAKDGMSLADFRAYYEKNHAPMAKRLFPMVADYRRNFIVDVPRHPAGVTYPGFDVVTENWFANEADMQAFNDKFKQPEVLAEVRADEAKFTQMDRTWSFIVDEVK